MSINGNCLGAGGGKALAKTLENNTTLISLSNFGNCLGAARLFPCQFVIPFLVQSRVVDQSTSFALKKYEWIIFEVFPSLVQGLQGVFSGDMDRNPLFFVSGDIDL